MSGRIERVKRFDTGQRLEHVILIAGFVALSISGLPQKYPDSQWGDFLIASMGGIERVRLIHHAAAVVLIISTMYHFVVVAYKVLVQRVRLTMLPGPQDVRDGLQALAYNLRLSPVHPHMGRYTFGEKIEYWAVVWGTAIMILTGFILWNPIATAKMLPGEFIPAAKAAHGGEALLAVLSIITWHLYNVHIRRFNPSIFTGYMNRKLMREEHEKELAELESGYLAPTPDAATLRRRRRIFVPVAAIVTLALLVGLYIFVTFEETAITTLPRQETDIRLETSMPVGPGIESIPSSSRVAGWRFAPPGF